MQAESRPALVILSGAFLGPEFAAEFGRLPPAMLPIGNRRLYERQLQNLGDEFSRVILTLPNTFDLPQSDRRRLTELGVELVFSPEELALTDAILFALASAKMFDHPVATIHGDTLLGGIDTSHQDAFSVAQTAAFYPWAEFEVDSSGRTEFRQGLLRPKKAPIVSGYFSFGDSAEFARCLTESRGDFLRSLNIYAKRVGLVPVETESWYDLGHLQTYYQARSQITSERSFNRLRSSRGVITKSGSKGEKILEEANWYQDLPPSLRKFTPQFLGRRVDAGPSSDRAPGAENPAYEIEFLPLPSLSDLFVFGQLPTLVWDSIFNACDEWLVACLDYKRPSPDAAKVANDLYLPKTVRRLEEATTSMGIDLKTEWSYNGRRFPSLMQVAEASAGLIRPPADDDICLVHGDFCFSNILYDYRLDRIKTIDPRGGATNGDIRYDVAKLSHSVTGAYDLLVAERYALSETTPYQLELEIFDFEQTSQVREAFASRTFASRVNGSSDETTAMTVLLFLSMLPLHSDRPDLQKAFVANALRLFSALSE